MPSVQKFLKPDHSCMHRSTKPFNMWETLYMSDINERKRVVLPSSKCWLNLIFGEKALVICEKKKKVKLSMGTCQFPWNFLCESAHVSSAWSRTKRSTAEEQADLPWQIWYKIYICSLDYRDKGIGYMPPSFLNYWAIYPPGKRIYFLCYFILLLKIYLP